MSSLVSRNIFIAGRRTSIRLEPELWDSLFMVAKREQRTVHEICTLIALESHNSSFTSAVRVFIVAYLRSLMAELDTQYPPVQQKALAG